MTTRSDHLAPAEDVIAEAMRATTGGLDPDRVAAGNADIVEAYAKQAAALKAAEYSRDQEVTCPHCTKRHVVKVPPNPADVARTMAHAAKAADGMTRLVEFVSGRPDSRADAGADWLRALTAEQLRIVSGWLAEPGPGIAGEAAAGAPRSTNRADHGGAS